MLLQQGRKLKDYSRLMAYLKGLTPSRLDSELRCMQVCSFHGGLMCLLACCCAAARSGAAQRAVLHAGALHPPDSCVKDASGPECRSDWNTAGL